MQTFDNDHLQPKLATAPRTSSELLFTKLQVHLPIASPLNLLLGNYNGFMMKEGSKIRGF